MALRAAYIIGVLLLLTGLVHLAILMGTGGSWYGPLSWRKPAVFGFSFGATLITIAWISSLLHMGSRLRIVLLSTFTVACIVETALIAIQKWRGVPSHFNVETPLDAVIARSLAGFGFLLVVVVVTLTIVSFRAQDGLPASLRLAIRTGFVALCVSMAAGGVMIANGARLLARGLPHVAYATAGALKSTHFVTMHAILVLPALAWLLSFTHWPEHRRLTVVRLCAIGYIVTAGAVIAVDIARVG